jgi:hypothetical protein
MKNLKEGLELTAISFDDPEQKCSWIVGLNCKRITVSMEAGQMGLVPWAVIDTGTMVNLALVEQVEIKGE